MTEENELPQGWALTSLGEIRKDLSKGIEPNKFPDQRFELYSVPNFEVKKPEIVLGSDIGSNKQTIESGTVLLCKINPRINRAWIVGDYSDNLKIASTEWISFFKLEEIVPAYLCYYLSLNTFRDFLASRASGVGGSLMRVKGSTFEDYPFPVPPLVEQQRIVEAIEQQLSRLDEGVTLLRQAQKKLKLYRASVLKAAVEGELTAEWRKSHPDVEPASELLKRILAERRAKWEEEQIAKGKDPQKVKYIEPAEPDGSGLPELPIGWYWAAIGQVTECLDYKRVPINKEERIKRSGSIPYYGANGQVGWINDYIFDEPLVLVVEDETFTGREIPFSYKIAGKTWVNNHAHVLQSTPTVHIDYLNYSLAYYPFTPLTQGTTGRRKLTQKALILAPYPLPPIDEQEQIVSLVEERLSIIEELESSIKKGLKQAERQRQSILQRAFTGKLAAQDPNDEPASVLLERIKREREEQAGQQERQRTKDMRSKKSAGATKSTRAIRVPEEEAEPLDVTGLKQESLWQEEIEEQDKSEEVEAQGVSWRNVEA